MESVDRLDAGGIREDTMKKERLDKVGDRAKDEVSMKSVLGLRLDDRAKSEEAKKQIRYESVTEKFEGTDQLGAQLDRLDSRAIMEQKKKEQYEQLDASSVRASTQTAETIDRLSTRAKEEELQKGSAMDRMELRFKDEASHKAIRVRNLAEKGVISPTESKELTSLVDKNLEARVKAFDDGKATTDTPTDTTVESKLGMGGTVSSMATGIQYAADRGAKLGMGGTVSAMAASIQYAADSGAKTASTDIGTKPADFTMKNFTDKAV
jgi:hypothetical protein